MIYFEFNKILPTSNFIHILYETKLNYLATSKAFITFLFLGLSTYTLSELLDLET